MAFDKPAVVIDNGSYNIKAGFACDNHPVSIFRTVVGRPNYLNGSYGRQFYEVKIGEDAVEKLEDLEMSYPVKNGRIVHWDNMERVWHHCFYKELKVAPEDRAVMLGCSSKTPIGEKVKCCEVFFETLNCPGLCLQYQSVLALFGSGFTTGLSLDLGYDTTDVNPVYEGGLLAYARMQTNLAGRDVTAFIKQRLEAKGVTFRSIDTIEDIKKSIYVTKDGVQSDRKAYVLPSGEEIDIDDEAYLAGEMLFSPEDVAMKIGVPNKHMSLQHAVVLAATKCDADLRESLLNAIVPWGGLGTIPGLNNRLEIEVSHMTRQESAVVSSPEPYTVPWLGGATFAGTPAAKMLWVSKEQYEEYGAKIVKNKFL